MELDRYELRSDQQPSVFRFLSEGRKEKFEKVVQFTLVNQDSLHNLAFGDWDSLTGEVDDEVVTDNGDSEKILATVVDALYAFCNQVPDAWVYATGSTASRTRLYRMGINRYYDIVAKDFEVFGQTDIGWQRYEKGKDYLAFVVQRKKTIFER